MTEQDAIDTAQEMANTSGKMVYICRCKGQFKLLQEDYFDSSKCPHVFKKIFPKH